MTGVAPRTLDFWVRNKLISPSVSPAKGSGSNREYSIADIVQCRVAVLLRAMGIQTSRIAPVLRYVANKGTAFVILSANGDITTIPRTSAVSTFQPNRTAMLVINLDAIRSEFGLGLGMEPLTGKGEA